MPLADLGDVSIHYEVRGEGPLTYVFCHGLGGSGQPFEETDMDWYAQHFRTISWDNRGLGRSGQAQKYALHLYAGDLARLLDHLAVERAVIFGVSWGGVTAIKFALDHPQKVAALVLDSTSSESNVPASENWYMRGELARLGEAALAGREMAPAFEGHQTVSATPQAPQVKPEHVESYVAECRTVAGLREHPLTPELHRITAPTLVVGGGKDTVAGAAGSVIISRHIPDARLEIVQDAGHGVYRQAPDTYRPLLVAFLADHGLM
ncbi:MAG: alpha/beta hydrolase [Dehalococcoidia bacterium]|nr:alpha/beta hydrolase [Dehalococcoidia bacterium]